MSSTDPQRHHWFGNWLSVIGASLFGFSTLLSIFLFFAAHGSSNIYLSVVTLVLMPALIFGGLGLFVLGNLIGRYRQKKLGKEYAPRLDLRVSHHRRYLAAFVAVGCCLFLISLYGAFHTYHFAESREFCGQLCHEVMNPEYVAHQDSPHANVQCTSCHVGPGPEHLIRSKWRGLYQVYSIAFEKFERPIHTPLADLRAADEICEQCHWPEKSWSQKYKEYVYYLPDEENTRFNTTMLLHIGSSRQEGDKPNIHWHANPDSNVFYVATDDQHQNIPLVKHVDKDGKETIFLSDDAEESAEELLAKHELHKMDCITCHNRSMHQFRVPQQLLNDALLAGRISPSLPYVKQKSLELFAAEHETQAAGLAAIKTELQTYYQEEHPEVWTERQADVEAAITAVQDLYARNVFNEMKADWRAHPDSIGHIYTNGCFRCHDNLHESEEGEVITQDCKSCHDFISQGAGDTPPSLSAPQDYKHPEDIDGLWEEALCTDCHTGVGAE
jgi:hypothetical protein